MNSKTMATVIVGWITIMGLVLTDPDMLTLLGVHVNGTLLSIINILGYSVIGFLVTTVIPDFYMDEEYKTIENLLPRAIHTLGLCIIYAVSLLVFIGH